MISIFDLYKIGIGPSSSHTVGPMNATLMFVENLEKENLLQNVTRVKCELFGSLGATGKGHGSDTAVILGLLGETPENTDTNLVESKIKHIKSSNEINLNNKKIIEFNYENDLILHKTKFLPYHPNAMSLTAYDENGTLIIERKYYSVGGGFVVTEEQANQKDTAINEKGENIKVPYPYTTAKQLLEICKVNKLKISEVVFANEKSFNSEKIINKKLSDIWQTMQTCVINGCENEGILPGGMKVKRRAKKLYKQLMEEKNSQELKMPLYEMDWVNLYALAVNEENAAGGRVVTAPTNGAAGIIPATLHYYRDFAIKFEEKNIFDFLLASAAIGMIIKQNASISGAEVGCQGEVGSACAMAAAGLTEILEGTPEQCANAAEIGMEHNLGLTCDPIGGLVQVPCIERNAMGAVKAINASRMARRGDGEHFVSLDEVIKTMNDTGKDMLDKYKETARGGLAINVIEVPVNFVDC